MGTAAAGADDHIIAEGLRPVLPAAVYETAGNRVLGVVRPPMDLTREGRLRSDIARLTQHLAYELEELISAHPEQWHLQSANWPSDIVALRAAGYSPDPLPGSKPIGPDN